MMAAGWLMLAAVSLALGAACSAVVLALQNFSRTRLDELAEARGPGSLRRVERIVRDVAGHQAAAALPRVVFNLVTLVGFVMWASVLRAQDRPDLASLGIGTGLAALTIWLLGLVIPMALADHAGERVLLNASGWLRAAHTLMWPVLGVVRVLDVAIRRLSGADRQERHEVIEQELLDVVEEHAAEGDLGQADRDMIEAVVEFRSTTVEQIMTPRTEIQSIDLSADLPTVLARVDELGHSRVPVHEGSLDRVVGILYAKDLLHWIAAHPPLTPASKDPAPAFDLRTIVRPAHFVPETKTVRELLTELLAKRVHIALVADEYGGTSGLITIEDIVEEVFGEIADEYDSPDEADTGVSVDQQARSADIDARTSISDANAELEDIGTELPESDEYDTVAGYVVWALGAIPEAGAVLERDALRVTVLDAEPTRVVRVRVEPLSPEQLAAARQATTNDEGE
jgi:CBS domain containing-hemolysin-like protein